MMTFPRKKMHLKKKMYLNVNADKNLPVTPRKNMKGKKGVIKVNNQSEVRHEEKSEDNELMKKTLLCHGMIVDEKLINITLAIMEINSKNRRKMTYSPDSFDRFMKYTLFAPEWQWKRNA